MHTWTLEVGKSGLAITSTLSMCGVKSVTWMETDSKSPPTPPPLELHCTKRSLAWWIFKACWETYSPPPLTACGRAKRSVHLLIKVSYKTWRKLQTFRNIAYLEMKVLSRQLFCLTNIIKELVLSYRDLFCTYFVSCQNNGPVSTQSIVWMYELVCLLMYITQNTEDNLMFCWIQAIQMEKHWPVTLKHKC